MIRRFFIAASVVSLLLCAATVAVWARSYRRGSLLTWSRLTLPNDPEADFVPLARYYSIHVGDGSGCVVLGYGNTWSQRFRPPPRWEYRSVVPALDYHIPTGSRLERLGFTWERGGPPDGLMDVTAPCWAIAGALAILPGLYGLQWLRGRQARGAGLCQICGYDLRASTGRCPECGTRVPCSKSAEGGLT